MDIKKTKICFLAPADSIHSYRWIKYFADKNHDIHWISLTPKQFETTKNIRFYPLRNFFLKPVGGKFLDGIKFFNVLLSTKLTRRLIRKINPDILHAHGAGIYGMIGAFSGFHPFVLTAWGSDILMARNFRIGGFLKGFILKKADLMTCDAQHMKEAMVKLGASESKIKIVNFGIDTQIFCPGPKDKELEKELRTSGSKIVMGVRRLEKFCDFETLIRAASFILKDFPKIKFIIIGKGSLENNLKKLAKSLRVEESIKFLGAVANKELPKYLRLSDIFVSTSLSDAGIASSTAEAMACGLPVVITSVADNRKWVEDGKNGFIIPIKSPEILAEKILYLLKNEESRKKFGEINRKIIEERNNYSKEMEKIEKIYKQLADKNYD